MTDHDLQPEPYVLTPEEEEKLIENAVNAAKDHYYWRMSDKGLKEDDIQTRMSQINWKGEIDRDSLFQHANTNKNYDLWQKEQRIKDRDEETKKYEALKERCSPRYMFWVMSESSKRNYDKEIIVNADNKKFITVLCYFLSNDQKFETELGYSFKKGLLIRGVSGIGKTHLIKCLEFNELNPIRILSMLAITDELKTNGEYEIEMNGCKIIYLDDVGTEEPFVKYYGTKITFFKDFIETTYLRNADFSKIIISTNNSFADIEERYGFRVRSRMKEMFNIIDVSGNDMRK